MSEDQSVRNSRWKFIWFSLSIVGCAQLYSSAAFSQNDADRPLKIGYVNAQDVVSNAPQARIALEELTQKYSAREAELLDLQNVLREIEQKLADSESGEQSESELVELRSQARSINRELERATADLNEDYNFDRNRRLELLQGLISEVILQMAREEGFDLIVQSPVVWASPRIDITGAILERLKDLSEQ